MVKFETSCIHFAVTASLLHYSWKRTTSVPDNPLLSTLSPYGCRNTSQVCALCTDRTEGQLYRPRLGKCKDRESRMIMYIDNDVDISVFALSWLHCTWVSRKNYTSCVTTKWLLNRQFIRLKIFFDQRVIWRCGHFPVCIFVDKAVFSVILNFWSQLFSQLGLGNLNFSFQDLIFFKFPPKIQFLI